MGMYLPGSLAVAWTKIFKMAPGSHFEYSFISQIFIFYETEMKFSDNLQIQVLNDSIFANFFNNLEV